MSSDITVMQRRCILDLTRCTLKRTFTIHVILMLLYISHTLWYIFVMLLATARVPPHRSCACYICSRARYTTTHTTSSIVITVLSSYICWVALIIIVINCLITHLYFTKVITSSRIYILLTYSYTSAGYSICIRIRSRVHTYIRVVLQVTLLPLYSLVATAACLYRNDYFSNIVRYGTLLCHVISRYKGTDHIASIYGLFL